MIDYEGSNSSNMGLPAPCIIDEGIVVNKRDIQRLLEDLSRVRYVHFQDGEPVGGGEGLIVEVFCDPCRSTLIANKTLYLNLASFDCLQLQGDREGNPYFDLVQEHRCVRLIPMANPLQDNPSRDLDVSALEAVVTEVLSARLDAEQDGDEPLDW
ncbi:hypothetical protein [Geitlerinema sp. PCC 9228]|jgi:hypothetical protein|uniref:hypothetical protein n=1 Tax=Geitlerinema sp. PCC 9228 TaxID=111611 RepID=UPI001B8B11CB|nr:hypothetical protein [Geitlerinema sp. PCC 9228]